MRGAITEINENAIGEVKIFFDKLSSYLDVLVQERRNSIANALELRLSCTDPSIWSSVSTIHLQMILINTIHIYVCVWVETWEHGPLNRYIKLWVAQAPGMPGTFSLLTTSKETTSLWSRHASGTCITHMPWCMSGSLARGGRANRSLAFPVHAQCAILHIWQEAHVFMRQEGWMPIMSELLHEDHEPRAP